jgi:hypothetical protein
VRAVPIAVIEKEVYLDFWSEVDVGVGYYDHGRRRRNYEGWGRRNSDRGIDIRRGNDSI